MRFVRTLFRSRNGPEIGDRMPSTAVPPPDARPDERGARASGEDPVAETAADTPGTLPAQTRLIASVLAAATRHDAACIEARAGLLEAFHRQSLNAAADLDSALDRSRREMTGLCADLGPTIRDGMRHLIPFARQLVSTRAIEGLDEDARIGLLRPLFEDDRFAEGAAVVGGDVIDTPGASVAEGSVSPKQVADETVIPDALAGRMPNEAATGPRAVEPEALLDHLLEHAELISYQWAYLVLLGPVSGPWRGAVHAPTVLQAAGVTGPRNIGGIDVRLEALIVNKKSSRPGQRHFRQPGRYTEDAWVARFGEWAFCLHTPGQIREATEAARSEPVTIGDTTG